MTNKEKVIAAFLVSVGMFSAAQASRYVNTLSDGEKTSLYSVSASAGVVSAVEGCGTPVACGEEKV